MISKHQQQNAECLNCGFSIWKPSIFSLRFIKAERTGDWTLHLQTVQEMLPYLAASGHNLYAKSARIYLQHMTELQQMHPQIYEKFCQGFHIVRRTNRYWGGLSTDLIIEQVLMLSLKTSGRLTRGRGMTEIQRLIWLMSMPACAEINLAMQELNSVNFTTSEQHNDLSKTRQDQVTKALPWW